MRYADSSSLLKLVWQEPESAAVSAAVAAESSLIISTLAEVEVAVQLRRRWLAGESTAAQYRRHREHVATLRETAPFEVRVLASEVFRTGIVQAEASRVHARTLDRLHVAAMQVLGLTKLMTNDSRQAEAARALGYDVVVPT